MDRHDQQQQEQTRKPEASTIIIPDFPIRSESSKGSSVMDDTMFEADAETMQTGNKASTIIDAAMQQQIQKSRDEAKVGEKILTGPYCVDLVIQQEKNINDHRQATGYLKNGSNSVKGHENKDSNLLRAAYILMKGDDWRKTLEETSILEQRNPLGNTVLHIAARYGNNEAAEHVTRQDHKLLKTQNSNGDTALHVAARAGNICTLQKLLASYFHEESTKYCSRFGQNFTWTTVTKNILEDMLSLALSTNKEGNTFFHEALIHSNKQCRIFQVLDASLVTEIEKNSLCTVETDFKLAAKQSAASITNNEGKTALYLAVEAGYKEDVNQLLDYCHGVTIRGKSPLLGAILKRNQDMLDSILSKKPEWIHLRDADGRTPLHYAASAGYTKGVDYLLEKCRSCAIERDNFGFYPLHLASDGGHVRVIDMLLEHSLDPAEIVDKDGRNILHIAAESGKLNVVKYILQSPELGNMIKQKDANGNTPMHLASLRFHPRIVHYLTWDKRVDLTLVNNSNQTPLDAMEKSVGENPPLSQRLTWIALKSAAAPKSSVRTIAQSTSSSTEENPDRFRTIAESTSSSTEENRERFSTIAQSTSSSTEENRERFSTIAQSTSSSTEEKVTNTQRFRDMTNTLIVVSTLIITATFAAALTMPGGNSGSDSDAGTANMINQSMFYLFIFSITVSMYGAIGVTIILFWSGLGDLTLTAALFKVGPPLVGLTLGTFSLSFLAGVYLVISKLTWLATTFLILSAFYIFMGLIFYIFLFFPSASSSTIMRYISFIPFLALAIVVESLEIGNRNGSTTFSNYT